MKITEIALNEYDGYFKSPCSIFLKAEFHLINTPLHDLTNIKAWIARFGNQSIGIIGYLNNETFASPYLATYGGLRYEGKVSFNNLSTFWNELNNILNLSNIDSALLTLPPDIYNPTLNNYNKVILQEMGFKLKHLDINQYLDLGEISQSHNLDKQDRKNIRVSQSHGLIAQKVTHLCDIKNIYQLIKTSRLKKNIPLKMSLEKILCNADHIPIDFWQVVDLANNLYAGAIILQTLPNVWQVVYWGHAHEHSKSNSLKFLSSQLFKYYQNAGNKFLDFGISTAEGIPNPGLIAFKESIGCKSCEKTTLVKIFNNEKGLHP